MSARTPISVLARSRERDRMTHDRACSVDMPRETARSPRSRTSSAHIGHRAHGYMSCRWCAEWMGRVRDRVRAWRKRETRAPRAPRPRPRYDNRTLLTPRPYKQSPTKLQKYECTFYPTIDRTQSARTRTRTTHRLPAARDLVPALARVLYAHAHRQATLHTA